MKASTASTEKAPIVGNRATKVLATFKSPKGLKANPASGRIDLDGSPVSIKDTMRTIGAAAASVPSSSKDAADLPLPKDYKSSTLTRKGIRKSDQLSHALGKMTSIVLNETQTNADQQNAHRSEEAARIEGVLAKVLVADNGADNMLSAEGGGKLNAIAATEQARQGMLQMAMLKANGVNDRPKDEKTVVPHPFLADVTSSANNATNINKNNSNPSLSENATAAVDSGKGMQRFQQPPPPVIHLKSLVESSATFESLPPSYKELLLDELAAHKRQLDAEYHRREEARIVELDHVRAELEAMAVKVYEGTLAVAKQAKALDERERAVESHRMRLSSEYEGYMADQTLKHKVIVDGIAMEKEHLSATLREREMALGQAQSRLLVLEKEYDTLMATLSRFRKKEDADSVAVDAVQEELKSTRNKLRELQAALEDKTRECQRMQSEKEASDEACGYYLQQLKDCIAKYQTLERRVAEAEQERFERDRAALAEKTRRFEAERQVHGAAIGWGDVRPSSVLADQLIANLGIDSRLKSTLTNTLLANSNKNNTTNANTIMPTSSAKQRLHHAGGGSSSALSGVDMAYALGDDVALLKEIVKEIKHDVVTKEKEAKKAADDERRQEERERFAIVYASGYAHPLARGNRTTASSPSSNGNNYGTHYSGREVGDAVHGGGERRHHRRHRGGAAGGGQNQPHTVAGNNNNDGNRNNRSEDHGNNTNNSFAAGGVSSFRPSGSRGGGGNESDTNYTYTSAYDTHSQATSTTNVTHCDPDTMSQRGLEDDEAEYFYSHRNKTEEDGVRKRRGDGSDHHRRAVRRGASHSEAAAASARRLRQHQNNNSHSVGHQHNSFDSSHRRAGSGNGNNSPPQQSQLLDISISTMSSYADAIAAAPLTPRELRNHSTTNYNPQQHQQLSFTHPSHAHGHNVHGNSTTAHHFAASSVQGSTPPRLHSHSGSGTPGSNASDGGQHNLGQHNNSASNRSAATTPATSVSGATTATAGGGQDSSVTMINLSNMTAGSSSTFPREPSLHNSQHHHNNHQQQLYANTHNNNSGSNSTLFDPFRPPSTAAAMSGPLFTPYVSSTNSNPSLPNSNVSAPPLPASSSGGVAQSGNVLMTSAPPFTPFVSTRPLSASSGGTPSKAKAVINSGGAQSASHLIRNNMLNTSNVGSARTPQGVVAAARQQKASAGLGKDKSGSGGSRPSSAQKRPSSASSSAEKSDRQRVSLQGVDASFTGDHSGLVVTGVGIQKYGASTLPTPSSSASSSMPTNANNGSTPTRGGGGLGTPKGSRTPSVRDSHRHGGGGGAGGESPLGVVISPLTTAGNTPVQVAALSGPFGFKSYVSTGQLATHFGASSSSTNPPKNASPSAAARSAAALGPFSLSSAAMESGTNSSGPPATADQNQTQSASGAGAADSVQTFVESLKASKAQILATTNYTEEDDLVKEMTQKIETYTRFLNSGKFS